MLPASSVAIIPCTKNAGKTSVSVSSGTSSHGTPAAAFAGLDYECYPAAVLFGHLLALALLTLQVQPVDVALDPGHSRADVGASGGGLREYQLTLDLARRVREPLEAAGLRVRLTREDDLPLTPL